MIILYTDNPVFLKYNGPLILDIFGKQCTTWENEDVHHLYITTLKIFHFGEEDGKKSPELEAPETDGCDWLRWVHDGVDCHTTGHDTHHPQQKPVD